MICFWVSQFPDETEKINRLWRKRCNTMHYSGAEHLVVNGSYCFPLRCIPYFAFLPKGENIYPDNPVNPVGNIYYITFNKTPFKCVNGLALKFLLRGTSLKNLLQIQRSRTHHARMIQEQQPLSPRNVILI